MTTQEFAPPRRHTDLPAVVPAWPLRRGLGIVALAVVLLWPAFTWAGWPSSADRLSGHLMFSFYIAQYANPAYDGFYARWDDTGHNAAAGDLMSMFWPHYAAYSNSEPCSGIYDHQSVNMKRAGVDVVVINWWSSYPGEQQRVEQALRCFGANGLKAIIAVYPNFNAPSFNDMVARLEAVIGWYARRGDLFPAYYRDPASGYPLFWVGIPDTVGNTTDWNAKIDWYKANTPEHGIFIAAETSLEWVRQTRFDGFYWTGSNGFDPAGDRHNHEWILYNLYGAGAYNQFYVGGGGPGIDERANCGPNPRVVDRQAGAVFNSQWSDMINSNWNGHKVDHAEVGWNDWGESEGIEPVASNPPLRPGSYQSCGGRVPQTYLTYAPLSEYWYLDRNAYWANQFKVSALDGDAKFDVVAYRSGTAEWFIRRSSDGGLTHVDWGCVSCGDTPVAADYDGDGFSDVAVFHTTTGEWLIRRSSDGATIRVNWGCGSCDIPVPADYDHDGRADVAVYRPGTGQWFILRSSDGGVTQVNWGCGSCGDIPVPADYDHDGRADIAVYRPSTGEWFILRSSDGGLTYVNWGCVSCGDIPVPADYDGDGRADIAVYRPSTGQWFILRSSDGGLTQINWGCVSCGDRPVPADYDGDGRADIAVYRPGTSEWFILRSSDGGYTPLAWGASGDQPVKFRSR